MNHDRERQSPSASPEGREEGKPRSKLLKGVSELKKARDRTGRLDDGGDTGVSDSNDS